MPEAIPPPDCNRNLMQMYRNVFSSPEGRAVFDDIMTRLCLVSPLMSDVDRARHNAACELIQCCGIYDAGFSDMLDQTPNWEMIYYGK